MATFGERLRELRKFKKQTQKELANEIGVSESTVSMYEMERREPDFETLEVLADYFNVDVDYLLGRTSAITYIPSSHVGSIVTKIPVYGRISAGNPFEAIEEIMDYIELPSWLSNQSDLFGLLVVGDSMNKIIPDGYIAVIQKKDDLEDGEIGAFLINGFDATLKKFYHIKDGILLEPQSHNPEHKPLVFKEQDDADVRIIGELVWLCVAKGWNNEKK